MEPRGAGLLKGEPAQSRIFVDLLTIMQYRGLAVEQTVPLQSLVHGEECWLSNGVGGFRRAILDLTKAEVGTAGSVGDPSSAQ